MKSEELSDPKLSLLIAEKMAELHQLNIPINKDSTWLWDTMDRWLQQPIKDINWLSENMELDQILSTNLCDETRWLKYEYNPYFIRLKTYVENNQIMVNCSILENTCQS